MKYIPIAGPLLSYTFNIHCNHSILKDSIQLIFSYALTSLISGLIESCDADGFTRLLDEHWALSQKIDSGSTNTLIDQILMVIDDLIDARMCCGAGGGGFLQVMLKKGVTRAQVHKRLKDVFQDFDVDIWAGEIDW